MYVCFTVNNVPTTICAGQVGIETCKHVGYHWAMDINVVWCCQSDTF